MYGFTVRNEKMELARLPSEDAFAFDEQRKIACVADLVTRDFRNGSVLTKNLRGLVKARLGMYHDYSAASDICVKAFLETKSLEDANKQIGVYNQEQGLIPTDYLARDLAGCTAAGFWDEKGFLHWQFICDSGIAVVNSLGDLRFRTPDEGPHSKEKNPHLEEILSQQGGFNNTKGRRMIRSQYRNNPQEEFAYGVLTGEETAIPYIKQGISFYPKVTYSTDRRKVKLETGDYVLAFTDGMADIIFNKNPGVISKWDQAPREVEGVIIPPEPIVIPEVESHFFRNLQRGNSYRLENFCQERVRSEGTLVVYKVE